MLSILIPTYNRDEFLSKNLLLLNDIIVKGGFQNEIKIIVSDNCSPDTTQETLAQFKESAKVQIDSYRQSENIGLKANALFVLEKSDTDYVMYLGDDDFISYEFLMESMSYLKSDPNTSAIIPNFINVTVDNNLMHESRDLIGPTELFKPGKRSLLKNTWKGHQMSGLIFKREGLYGSYVSNKVDNIYPYVYFTGLSCLKGNVYMIKDHLIRVTQPIKKKDWGYGEDGLLNEFFDNFKKLPVPLTTRFQLEAGSFLIQDWRLMNYWRLGSGVFWKAAYKMAFASNSSILFTLSFPILLLLIKLKRKINA